MLSAIGSIFSDVLLFRWNGFAVTIPHLLLAMTTGMVIFRRKRFDYRLAFIFILMVLVEIIHAIAVGFAMSSEWHKSFAQFIVYGMCFVALTKLKLDRETLAKSAPWAMKLGIFIGGLGVLQFILFRIGVSAYLPEGWRVRSLDILNSSGRYSDFSPAVGLAMEPSYYAIGLVTLLAFLLYLKRFQIINANKLYFISVIMLILGVYFSFSLTGIIISSVLLIQQLFSSRNIIKAIFILAAIISFLWIPGLKIGLIEPIQSRLQRVVQGLDNSALIRVTAATRLLFARSSSLETSVFGTGLGMEDREKQVYLSIYEMTSLAGFNRDEVKIHSIITSIKYFQGLLGLIFYGALLWIILQPLAGKYKAFFPILVLFVLFHFSSGLYLTPIFWSSLALVTLLRRATLANALERENNCLP